MLPWISLAQASPIIGGGAATGPVAGQPGAAPVGAPVGPGAATDTSTVAATQTGVATTQAGGGKAAPGGLQQLFGSLWFPGLLLGVMLLFMFRGSKKEEKSRKAMISNMKKGDEVMTIGGLIGKVVDVREDRVVLKVDEGNNVKETYLKSAIQKVLTGEEDGRMTNDE